MQKQKRTLAIVLAAVVAVSALAVGLGGTFAAKPDIIGDFTAQPNEYATVAKGSTVTRLISGGAYAVTSDASVASVPVDEYGSTLPLAGPVQITGEKAGVAVISVGSTAGLVRGMPYQVFDSSLIEKYTLKKNGEVFLSTKGSSTAARASYLTVDLPNAAAADTVKWKSFQPEAATVDENTGLITAVAKGAALIAGTFTDKWGIARDLHVVVFVDMRNGSLGELMDWINKGEAILDLDLEENPYTTDSLTDLENAVNGGKGVAGQADPGETDIQNAIDAIRDAIDGLEKLPPGTGKPDHWIPKPGGGWYRPVGDPPNVYEVMDEDGKSKQPPEYIYNEDGDPAGQPGKNRPARPYGPFYYVEDPVGSNIWKKVKGDGTLQDSPAWWGGPGSFGDGGEKEAVKFPGSDDYWVHIGQNVWRKVNKLPANTHALDPELVGGGPNENPVATPARPIVENGGKYYVHVGTENGYPLYYGDKQKGGDGKLNSTPGTLHGTDEKYYLIDGKMVSASDIRIDRVVVSPASVNAQKNSTQSFTARVIMTVGDDDPAGVTWALVGNTTYLSANTKIISSTAKACTIQIAADEANTEIALIATSVNGSQVYHDTAIININDDPNAIKSVVINGATTAVIQGGTETFTATVTKNDNTTVPPPNVAWTLTGNTKSGTSINLATGLLTVAADEPIGTLLTIKAVAIADGTVYDTRTVQVILDPNGIGYVVITDGPDQVIKGTTANYTGKAYKNDGSEDAAGVTWTVTGGGAGTSINAATGALTVGASEPNGTVLTVKATSVTDGTVFQTITVTVLGPSDGDPDVGDGEILGTDKTGDTSEWIRIATSGAYSLIVRKNYISIYNGKHGQYDWNYAAFGLNTNYNHSENQVRPAINAWFKNAATGDKDNLPANARLRNYTMQNNAAQKLGEGSSLAGMFNAFSKPTTTQIPSGDDVAFALSYTEAANFCSKTHDIRPITDNLEVKPSAAQAIFNFGRLNIPQVYEYGMWLRTPGDISGTAGALDYTGRAFQFHISPSTSNERGLVYPALWVKSTIFTDPVVNLPGNGGTFTDDKNVDWIVLTTDSNGNKLLMTKYVYMFSAGSSPQYHGSNWVTFKNAALAGTMQTWFNNNAGGITKAIACDFTSPADETGSFSASWNQSGARNSATGAAGTGKPFALSVSEYNQYLTNTGALQKKGYDVNNPSQMRDWWLRSPNGTSGTMGSSQGDAGSALTTSQLVGIRPCVWVKP